jgi:hypothetical protein
MPYIFLKEENQGNEDLVKIGDCQNRKNNLSKLTRNVSRVNYGPAIFVITHQRCRELLESCDTNI